MHPIGWFHGWHQQLSTLRFPSSEPVSDVPGKGHGWRKISGDVSGWGPPARAEEVVLLEKLFMLCLCTVFFGGSTFTHQPILGKVQCLQYFLLMYQVVFMLFMAIYVCANWLGVLLGVLSHVVSISRMYWQQTQWKRDLNVWGVSPDQTLAPTNIHNVWWVVWGGRKSNLLMVMFPSSQLLFF